MSVYRQYLRLFNKTFPSVDIETEVNYVQNTVLERHMRSTFEKYEKKFNAKTKTGMVFEIAYADIIESFLNASYDNRYSTIYVSARSSDGTVVVRLKEDPSSETRTVKFTSSKDKPTNEVKQELLEFYVGFCKKFLRHASNGLFDILFAQVPERDMEYADQGGHNAFKLVGKHYVVQYPFPVASAANEKMGKTHYNKIRLSLEHVTEKKPYEGENIYFFRWMSLIADLEEDEPDCDSGAPEPEAKKAKQGSPPE